MKQAVINFLNRKCEPEEINGGETCPTYLYRWTLLSIGWLKVYLHHFVREDWSKDLHDHPKRFVTIGLRGKYREITAEGEKVYRAPWIRSFPAEHAHRLEMIEGGTCWTIAIVFKTVRPWGFIHEGRWIPWRQYVDSETAEKMKTCN